MILGSYFLNSRRTFARFHDRGNVHEFKEILKSLVKEGNNNDNDNGLVYCPFPRKHVQWTWRITPGLDR